MCNSRSYGSLILASAVATTFDVSWMFEFMILLKHRKKQIVGEMMGEINVLS